MQARNSRKKRRRHPGLLLTPFIDVIFLLALFFIVNTSFRQERYLDVNLPESETSKNVQAAGIVLELRNDGSAAVDGKEIPWEMLTVAIERRVEETGATEVILRGDQALPYGTAVAALDRIQLAGLAAISLQTVRAVDRDD